MRRLIFFAILIASVLVINNLIHSIFSLWKKHDLIGKAQKEVQEQKKENKELSEKLKEVESTDFVERQARDKLFMVKPGEKMIILPSSSPAPKKSLEDIPNWKKWWQLFF